MATNLSNHDRDFYEMLDHIDVADVERVHIHAGGDSACVTSPDDLVVREEGTNGTDVVVLVTKGSNRFEVPMVKDGCDVPGSELTVVVDQDALERARDEVEQERIDAEAYDDEQDEVDDPMTVEATYTRDGDEWRHAVDGIETGTVPGADVVGALGDLLDESDGDLLVRVAFTGVPGIGDVELEGPLQEWDNGQLVVRGASACRGMGVASLTEVDGSICGPVASVAVQVQVEDDEPGGDEKPDALRVQVDVDLDQVFAAVTSWLDKVAKNRG